MCRYAITKGNTLVKNHSMKNKARNIGGKYTEALSELSVESVKYTAPVISERLQSILGKPQTLAELFVGAVGAFTDGDDVNRSFYDDVYVNGLEGESIKEIVLDNSYFKHDDVSLDEIPEPPTSAQLVEVYGTWNAVMVACEMKAFNGYLIGYTESLCSAPDYNGDDGVQAWPEWLGLYNVNPGDELSDETVAEIKKALELSDMAHDISEGKEPDLGVLDTWRSTAKYWMGDDAIPDAVQLFVLKAAREYLTPYLAK